MKESTSPAHVAGQLLHIETIRSPAHNGSIVSINIPHLPRGYRSFMAEDFPGKPVVDLFGRTVPILASRQVSYMGEPIALIAGPDLKTVSEAVRLTRIVIDEKPGVFNHETFVSSRILASQTYSTGRPEEVLSSASKVVAGDFRLGPQDHYYPETQRASAAFDYDKLIIDASTQWPFHARDAVAGALSVKPDEIVIRPGIIGPHLDGKLWYPSIIACQVALVAMLSGQKASLVLSRYADFMYTTKRAPILASYQAGMDDEGHLIALIASIAINMGAYGPLSDEMVSRALAAATGCYHCPNVRIQARALQSNLAPMGAFAGIGSSTAFFGMERIADDCAMAMEMDPADWRMLNVISQQESPAGKGFRRAVPYKETLIPLLETCDYTRKRGAYELLRKRRTDPATPPGFGIGLSFGYQSIAGVSGGPGAEPSLVEVELDRGLTIRTSSVPGTTETLDIWKNLAAEAIGITHDQVSIEILRTDRVPNSGPATMSRNISVITRLILGACEGIRTRRFREALPIVARKAYRPRQRKAGIKAWFEEASWAGAVVELELDPYTLMPNINGVWLSIKAGRILAPAVATRTMENAVATALTQCMAERLDLSNGSNGEVDFRQYRLPAMQAVPPISIHFLEDNTTEALGIGELAFALIPAAFGNALSQALDAPCSNLPIDGPIDMLELPT